MAVDSQVFDQRRHPQARLKYIYKLKFCGINRFSNMTEDLHRPCNKVLRWVEYEQALPDSKTGQYRVTTLEDMKRKFLKFPFKCKYLKQDLVLEVSSCLDTRDHNQPDESYDSSSDHRNVETLLFKCAFQIQQFLTSQNKWVEPYLMVYQPMEGNSAKILAKEFKVTQKTLISFCI